MTRAQNTSACLIGHALHFGRRGVPHGREVLHGASLQLYPGEVLALLGANGAGKSTLLRLLLGLLKPSSGEVLLEGRPLAAWRRREVAQRMAYVPQWHAPPFPYTVSEVAALGRLPHQGLLQRTGESGHNLVTQVLDQLGLASLADRPYTEISGGERQRTLIARALVQGASILVFDEPANGLDYGHQLRLLERLRTLAAQGFAVLFTTHHPAQALAAADRVALLHHGRISAEGPPAEVLTATALGEIYGLDPARLAGHLQNGFPVR